MIQEKNILNNLYQIEDKKYENFIYKEYSAYDTSNNSQVTLKILNNSALSLRTENIIRYHNDLYTASQINHPTIHKIHHFFEENTTFFLVNELFKGDNLIFYIQQKIAFTIDEIIDIIIQLAKALELSHKENIFYRHITPEDVLIIRSNGNSIPSVKLSNVGFVHLIDLTKIDNHKDMIGIFPYMSPEECGVIKRSMNASSDLYSLGILFYQLLTQILPFSGLHLSSIIHQHIAKVPQLPSTINLDVPFIIDNIIVKLLAKDPIKRYQSAKGLIKDLERIKNGKMEFLPGIDDEILNLSFKTNMIGRDDKFQLIKDSIAKTITDKGGIFFIKGKSGFGKSRLLEETKAYTYAKNITYISGKCFSHQNKTPYGPMKDALLNYLNMYNTYKEERKEEINKFIQQNIDELGQVLVNFLPQLKTLFGDCTELIELDNDKESQRFLVLLSNFIFILAKVERGLIIAIDDLQWADEGTFAVMNTLLYEISSSPLLLMNTYRDNEVDESHGITEFSKNAERLNVSITKLKCEPFYTDSMFSFISALLHNKATNIKEISNFIHKKSGGNPFFVIEILKHIISKKAIFYQNDKWNIDWELIKTIEFPPTILNLVMKRISLLNEMESTILSHAAVIGREFKIDLLYKLVTYNKKAIVEVVDKAIYLQLLEFDPYKKKKIFFVHDRIKEAFYAKLDDEKKKELHSRIAYALEEDYLNGEQDILFQLAHHYIEGHMEDKILRFAIPAGIIAKESFAHNEAIKYFKKAIEIIEKHNSTDIEKLIITHKSLAEIYLLTGKYDKSIILFDKVLPLLKTDIQRAQIYHSITAAYFKKGDFIKSEEYGRIALNILGEKLPDSKISVVFEIVIELIKHFINNIFLTKPKIPADQKKLEKYKLIVSIYLSLNHALGYSDLTKFIRSLFRMLDISVKRIGKSKELAVSYTAYGVFCGLIALFKRAIIYHNKAITLRKNIGDEYGLAQSLQYLGYCYQWKGMFKEGISYINESLALFNKFGDIREYGVSTLGLAECSLNMSNYSKAKLHINKYLDLAKKTNNLYAETNAYLNMSRILFESGHLADAEKIVFFAYNKSYKNNIWFVYFMSLADLGKIYLEKNNIYKAQEYLEQAKLLAKKNNFMPHYIAYMYNLIPEAYIAEYQHFHSKKIRKGIIKKIKKSCREALNKTKPWKAYYIEALRVKAKYYAIINKNKKAEELFCQSIELGDRIGRKYELGKSYYEYGMFLKNTKKTIEAKQKIEFAYKIFDEINAINLKEKISAELNSSTTSVDHIPNVKLMDKQRFNSIINVSQDICSILNPDDLSDKVLQKAIEITGAQSGYLFIKNENTDELKIKASINVTEMTIPESILEIVNEVYLSEKTIITSTLNVRKSEICVPLVYKNETIGACYLYNNLSHNIFSEEDKEVLEVIMTQAAISLINARLYELATVDGLTKLYIQRHFQLLLERELTRSKRYNHSCSLIMADIDHFKKVNDTYGHQFGDNVLQITANIIKANSRSTDITARYGGEEFCIILPETDINNALIVAEKIRKSIEAHTYNIINEKIKITISLGVAEYPFNAGNKQNLIEAADKALYKSKETGRNRVTIYEKKIE